MKYNEFKSKVSKLAKKTGMNVRFKNDGDAGKFYANFTDGTTIIARSGSSKVTVRYGSGHQAMTTL